MPLPHACSPDNLHVWLQNELSMVYYTTNPLKLEYLPTEILSALQLAFSLCFLARCEGHRQKLTDFVSQCLHYFYKRGDMKTQKHITIMENPKNFE